MTTSSRDADLEYVRRLVYTHSGIVLPRRRNYLIETRLASIAAHERLKTIHALVGRLRAPSGTRLRARVVDSLTTNETSFFRDKHPFDTLASTLLPAYARTVGHHGLTIWSCACSSGQEPFSVAMILLDRFPALAKRTKLIASDLSDSCLSRARAGRYSDLEVAQGLPTSMRERFFCRRGDKWQLGEAVRNLVQFRRVNIANDNAYFPSADIVLLRNVLIYFDYATKLRILNKVAMRIRPGGVLFLGAQETNIGITTEFVPVNIGKTTYYQRTAVDNS